MGRKGKEEEAYEGKKWERKGEDGVQGTGRGRGRGEKAAQVWTKIRTMPRGLIALPHGDSAPGTNTDQRCSSKTPSTVSISEYHSSLRFKPDRPFQCVLH